MNDLKREKEIGFDFEYFSDVPEKKKEVGDKYITPGFGIAAQLFSSVAKFVIEKLGPEEGELLLKEAVEYFGKERGKRIAEKVRAEGKPLTFKNWIIYSDLDSTNLRPIVSFENGDCVIKTRHCKFHKAAKDWGA